VPADHPGDLRVLQELQRRGATLSQPRHVLHYLYFPTPSEAESAAVRSRKAGYEASVKEAAKGPGWLCLAEGTRVVDRVSIAEARTFFESLAGSEGEYDGWEASAQP
jgi:hypothetical protein